MGRKATGAAAIAAVALATSVASGTGAPLAGAPPCPDSEVIFARGTTEDPGIGPTGQAFVDALRGAVGPKSVGVYAVDYPATTDFPTAVLGINNARAHILSTAANCPLTKMVLGGFSQGAAVVGFVTASVVPDGVSPADVPAPMPPEIADHIVAVALFGKPSARFMTAINDPPVVVGPNYVAKTIDLCIDNDLVCDPHGRGFAVHNTYPDSGMVEQATAFTASRLQASWAADALAAQPTPVPTPAPVPAPRLDQLSAPTEPAQHLPPVPGVLPGPPPPTTAAPSVPSAPLA